MKLSSLAFPILLMTVACASRSEGNHAMVGSTDSMAGVIGALERAPTRAAVLGESVLFDVEMTAYDADGCGSHTRSVPAEIVSVSCEVEDACEIERPQGGTHFSVKAKRAGSWAGTVVMHDQENDVNRSLQFIARFERATRIEVTRDSGLFPHGTTHDAFVNAYYAWFASPAGESGALVHDPTRTKWAVTGSVGISAQTETSYLKPLESSVVFAAKSMGPGTVVVSYGELSRALTVNVADEANAVSARLVRVPQVDFLTVDADALASATPVTALAPCSASEQSRRSDFDARSYLAVELTLSNGHIAIANARDLGVVPMNAYDVEVPGQSSVAFEAVRDNNGGDATLSGAWGSATLAIPVSGCEAWYPTTSDAGRDAATDASSDGGDSGDTRDASPSDAGDAGTD